MKVALVAPFAALVGAASLTHLLHLQAATARTGERGAESIALYLPSGPSLRPFTMGQQTTVADLYWLKLLQYIGTDEAQEAGWPQLFALGELITDLDPKYGYAYQVTGILLGSKKRFDESNEILLKGIPHDPLRWQLPFYAAFNAFYEQGDVERGAALLAQAAKLPGVPDYLPLLASRAYSTAGQLELAIGFVSAALEQSPTEEIRKELSRRRFELAVERDLQLLERAIEAYRAREGALPPSLDALVGRTLAKLPQAADGSAYWYDPKSGTVSSPRLPERIKLHEERPDVPVPVAKEPEE